MKAKKSFKLTMPIHILMLNSTFTLHAYRGTYKEKNRKFKTCVSLIENHTVTKKDYTITKVWSKGSKLKIL